jgi:hypothetical protein
MTGTLTIEKSRAPAILQFEVDRARWSDTKGTSFQSENDFVASPMARLYAMAKTAACDTLFRGGTFVLVVSPTKITMVQRPDAEDL